MQKAGISGPILWDGTDKEHVFFGQKNSCAQNPGINLETTTILKTLCLCFSSFLKHFFILQMKELK